MRTIERSLQEQLTQLRQKYSTEITSFADFEGKEERHSSMEEDGTQNQTTEDLKELVVTLTNENRQLKARMTKLRSTLLTIQAEVKDCL